MVIMGTGQTKRKRRAHAKKKQFKKYFLSTKHRSKDLDQIQEEVAKGKVRDGRGAIASRGGCYEYDEDLPGGGQFYCVETGRHFVDAHALREHKKSKAFKKRLKELKEKVYNQDEADLGAGITKEVLPSVAEARKLQSNGRG